MLVVALAADVLPMGSGATLVACAAILLFGLPHGSLDIETIKHQRAAGAARVPQVLLLYVGLAAAMYALWRIAPVAALAAFLVIAVVHFAEDWRDARSAFLAQGIAVSLLTAPALFHLAELDALFVALSGRVEGGIAADLMLLLAPMSMAVATIALASLWADGHRSLAVAGVAAIAGMTLLPPAIGFAAFFCLFHSPRHFRAAVADLSGLDSGHRRMIVVVLTLAALGVAAWLFASEVRADLTAQAVAASFMTLSILTVPHMAVPALLAMLSRADRVPVLAKEPSHAD